MLFLLVRKELLEQLLSLRFALACIICLVIMLSSAFVLTRDYKEALADYRTNLVMHKTEIEESRNLPFDGIKVDKPLNPMQIFFKGINEELTVTAKVSGVREPQFEADYEGNPVSYLFPPIDLLFFIGIVMSLLAIAFSYDSIAGEKELGTLKLLMSYSVPRDVVILAKWIGGYLAMVGPFIISLLCGLLVVVLFPTVELNEEHWAFLGLILLVSLLYLSVIYTLGMFVSSRTHLASTSITILLMVWVLIVLVIPNTAPYIASQLTSVRSFVLVEKEKNQLKREEEKRFQAEVDVWAEANPDIPKWYGYEWWANYNTMQKDHLPKVMDIQDRINEQFQKSMNAQIALAQNISRASPFASFAYAASDLAGTGIRDRNLFLDQLPQYRREITDFGLDAYIEANKRDDWRSRTIDGYPQFTYEDSVISDRLNWIDILILCVWNIIFFLGAYLSFLRYDVM